MRTHTIHLPLRHRPGHRAALRVGNRTLDPAVWLEACDRADAPSSGVRLELDGQQVALKAGPVAPSGGRRFRARRVLTGRLPPAEAEFEHLLWLRERLFDAPEPLVAITITRRGTPVRQLLATLWLDDVLPFDDAWRLAGPNERTALALELGREMGRMHALRFLHGDAYPRNVLVRPATVTSGAARATGRRIVWIDAWAGGPSSWPRGSGRQPTYDLGTWLSEAADWMASHDQRELLNAYLDARRTNGRPVKNLDRFVARVAGDRRRQLARLEHARARLRGRAFPIAGWCPPDLGRSADPS